MSRILVIAVPAGRVHSGIARLRALVVPQLDTDDRHGSPLSDYGFQDWPNTIDQVKTEFVAHFAPDTSTTSVSKSLTLVPHASTSVWNGFFSKAVVRPPVFTTHRDLDVSPTSTDAHTIMAGYTAAAGMHTGDDSNAADDAAAVVREQYGNWTAPPRIPPQPDDFGVSKLSDDSQSWRAPDFQRTVSMLREHPTVALQLGLILDFTLPAADVPVTAGDGWHLISIGSALRSRIPATVDIVTPWTKFHFDRALFLPWAARESGIKLGVVDLAGAKKISAKPESISGRWGLATFDVAGAVARLREGAQRATDGTAPSTLPVLHSSGLTLVRRDREQHLRARLENSRRAQANRSGDTSRSSGPDVADQLLTADDLMLGYRVDIKEQSGDWTSLCQRTATYYLDNVAFGPEAHPEEGQVKANAASVEKDNVLRADEAVVRWYGWSLAFPRPQFDRFGERKPDKQAVDVPFNFRWEFKQVPHTTLIPLRFGRGYHMRVRVADMAGSGLDAGDVGDEHQSDLVVYRRHEPVPAPEFAIPADLLTPLPGRHERETSLKVFGPGGTIDRLVIRSDPAGEPPLDVDQFKAAHPGYPANDTRIVLPPPTSMTLAEQHGALDGADLETWRWVQRAMSAPAADSNGGYNWLPDPAALQVQAYVRKHLDSPAPGHKRADEWGPRWPDFDAKIIELQPWRDGDEAIEWVDGVETPRRTLNARVDAGLQVEVEISSTIRAGDIGKFEAKDWANGDAEDLIPEGRHPMATPPRVVELVHAVRRPINPPASTLSVWRSKGDPFAVLIDGDQSGPVARGLFGIHRASTGQVDVAAEWREPVDSETPGPVVTEQVTSLAVGRDVEAIADGDPLPSADDGTRTVSAFRHDFGDTRHRMVTYTLTALSRFNAFFTDGADEALKDRFQHSTTLPVLSIPSSARPAPPVVLSVSPAFTRSVVTDESAQVRRIRRGNTVRVELARPWNVSGDDEQLAVVIASDSSDRYLRQAGRYLSRIYRDPIWNTDAPGGYLQRDMFLEFANTATCALDEVDESAIAISFPVSFSEETNRWWADIDILLAEPGPYSPMVRLALARYQPESVRDCELSCIAMTDFVSLMPDRTLLVDTTVSGGQVTVTLQLIGVEHRNVRPNKVIAVLESCPLPEGAIGPVSDITAAEDGHVGLWHRDGITVTGSLNTPLPPISYRPGTSARRIVVREYEDIESPVPPAPEGTFTADLQQRTVFLDIVALP